MLQYNNIYEINVHVRNILLFITNLLNIKPIPVLPNCKTCLPNLFCFHHIKTHIPVIIEQRKFLVIHFKCDKTQESNEGHYEPLKHLVQIRQNLITDIISKIKVILE